MNPVLDQDALDEARIRTNLEPRLVHEVKQITVLQQTSSTNDELLRRAKDASADSEFCFAEFQTKARGQRGRPWQSSPNTNLHCSALFRFAKPAAELNGLSLAIAMYLHDGLSKFINLPKLAIKWPNDIWWNQQKLAGILTELCIHPDSCSVVIVIGINVNAGQEHHLPIDQAWTSLRQINQHRLCRNKVAAMVVNNVTHAVEQFKKTGFAPFKTLWPDYDLLYQQEVSLHYGEEVLSGIAQGVDEQGRFCLEQQGRLRYFSAGEISLCKEGIIDGR